MSSRPGDAPPEGGAIARPPRPGASDRLGATLALALIVHGVLILGIGFAVERPAAVHSTLEVILTPAQPAAEPEEADFLAQASRQGGGDSAEPERPSEAQRALLEAVDPGPAPEPLTPQAPEPIPEPAEPLAATIAESRSETAAEPEPDPPQPLPSAEELIETRLEMARLAAEIERERVLQAKAPKRKFVSASTREFEWAGYVQDWVRRVERVGNLNYPDEARRRGLAGSLVLTVAVRRDGSVESIDLIRSSGQPLLDEAAIRSVRLAQPFPALPESREPVDVLHITRTWRYLPEGRLERPR